MSIYNLGNSANKKNDFPEGDHYAIIEFKNLTYDDGYGNANNPSRSTLTYIDYRWWEYSSDGRKKWLERIEELEQPKYGYRSDYIALDNGKRVSIEMNVQVSVR